MKNIPELTEQDYSRAISRSQRKRLMDGLFETGHDIVALRRFVGLSLPLLLVVGWTGSIPAENRVDYESQESQRTGTTHELDDRADLRAKPANFAGDWWRTDHFAVRRLCFLGSLGRTANAFAPALSLVTKA